MSDLTASQRALLEFLRTYIGQHGYPPSYREMAAALEFRSTNGVAYQLRCLEEKGYLARDSQGAHARAIRLTARVAPPPVEGAVQVPLLGQVAAGAPIAAEQIDGETLLMDSSLCPSRGVFALRVTGDSMVEAGIFEGDLLFVQRRSQVFDGDIVVAVIEGEATVKTYRVRRGAVFLEPANRRMKPIPISAAVESFVAGVVVGVYRQLE